jgi:hypothetical protein
MITFFVIKVLKRAPDFLFIMVFSKVYKLVLHPTMELLLKKLFLLHLISICVCANASTISVVNNNGNWEHSSTWDLNRVPVTGDQVIVPSGKTVQVNSNVYNSVPAYPKLNIEIYGTLQFVGSGQLNLQCYSTVCTKETGSIPSTGCNCNQIAMGTGEAPWKGSYPTVSNGNCVTSPCGISLAAELLFFEVDNQDNNVKLTWHIKEADDLKQLIIEYSTNAIDFKSKIIFTNDESSEYYDEHSSSGISYYRLKLVSKDDVVFYSIIKSVNRIKSNNSFTLLPNPAVSGEPIQIISSDEIVGGSNSFIIFDSYGRCIPLSISKNDFGSLVEFSTPLLPGVYFISEISEGINKTERFLVY